MRSVIEIEPYIAGQCCVPSEILRASSSLSYPLLGVAEEQCFCVSRFASFFLLCIVWLQVNPFASPCFIFLPRSWTWGREQRAILHIPPSFTLHSDSSWLFLRLLHMARRTSGNVFTFFKYIYTTFSSIKISPDAIFL